MKSPVTALANGLARVAARPHLLAVLLVLNFTAAWLTTAPIRHVLGSHLDRSLQGDDARQGPAWRWWDAVAREESGALGDAGGLRGFFTDAGVTAGDLLELSGPAQVALVVSLLLFFALGIFHCAFLGHLYPDRRGGFAVACVRYAGPALSLSGAALLAYWLIYRLVYVALGGLLREVRAEAASETVALAMTWSRLALTLVLLLAVKVVFDLGRVILVDRKSWNWPWALLLALRELLGHAPRYVAVHLGVGVATLAVAAIWWLGRGLLPATGGWLATLVLFVLHQVFLAARIGLRLSGFAALQDLYRSGQAQKVPPPFKVERP